MKKIIFLLLTISLFVFYNCDSDDQNQKTINYVSFETTSYNFGVDIQGSSSNEIKVFTTTISSSDRVFNISILDNKIFIQWSNPNEINSAFLNEDLEIIKYVVSKAEKYLETALTIEPENPDLISRIANITKTRAADLPTVPSTLGLEKHTNPFLRADLPALQTALNMVGIDPAEVFAAVRKKRDNF